MTSQLKLFSCFVALTLEEHSKEVYSETMFSRIIDLLGISTDWIYA